MVLVLLINGGDPNHLLPGILQVGTWAFGVLGCPGTELSKRLGSMGYFTYKWGIHWGYNPLTNYIVTNFLGHPSRERGFYAIHFAEVITPHR